MANTGKRRLANPALLYATVPAESFIMSIERSPQRSICDIQEKFRSAIYEYPQVISTAQKMLAASKILDIPIYCTTQNASRLGSTVSELSENFPPNTKEVDKTAFSMMVPEITNRVLSQSKPPTSGPLLPLECLLVGIESHICVTQTALDLLSMGHKVYVLQDGVSSCNAGERGVALARLRQEGAVVTTSESVLFELVGDTGEGSFKAVSGLVKEMKESTRAAVESFCGATGGGEGGGATGVKL